MVQEEQLRRALAAHPELFSELQCERDQVLGLVRSAKAVAYGPALTQHERQNLRSAITAWERTQIPAVPGCVHPQAQRTEYARTPHDGVREQVTFSCASCGAMTTALQPRRGT